MNILTHSITHSLIFIRSVVPQAIYAGFITRDACAIMLFNLCNLLFPQGLAWKSPYTSSGQLHVDPSPSLFGGEHVRGKGLAILVNELDHTTGPPS